MLPVKQCGIGQGFAVLIISRSGVFVCLSGLRLYVPVNNFPVMSGRIHRFLGITSSFWEVNLSCSRIQHGQFFIVVSFSQLKTFTDFFSSGINSGSRSIVNMDGVIA